MEKLAALKPAFDRTSGQGTLTAGNSTGLSDGAAAVLLASEDWAAQRGLGIQAWFRDAEVAAKFPLAPGQSAQAQYGSVFPMCQDQFKATLTAQRTAQLKAWLDGVAEGDACAGSVKPAPLP